jgi:4-hydroxy-tetrahydrodipicolinate synthase
MFEDVKARLEGCVYTIFTPFNEDESIDFDSLEKYLVTLYRGGARKFYAMAYNSRYSQLTDKEIFDLNEYCVKLLKNLNKSNLVIVGDPIHCSTKTSSEFTAHAKDVGADLISLIVREKYFSDEQILEHYASIGRACKFPQLVHEMPFLSGFDGKQMHWPMSLLDSLRKIPQIAALKEDAKNYDITKHALSLQPDIRVVIAGFKQSFVQYVEYGAGAYLNGVSIIDARIGELFWSSLINGDNSLTEQIIETVERPFVDKLVKRFGWHQVNKAMLEAAGFMSRRERMPLMHISDDNFFIVKSVYEEVRDNFSRIESV